MSPSAERRDDGVSLILVAASLLMIFGLASMVIDAGIGWSERRQAQSAADFAVLATFQEATSCDGSACDLAEAAENGAEEAIRLANLNLPDRYTPADWSACTDPNRPPRFDPSNGGHVAGGITQCVAFTANFDEARVVLPDDVVDTSFARVIGFDTLTTGAFAEAGQGIDVSALILPLNPTGGGPEVCLFTNQEPQGVEPCDGPSTGSFGYIDIALYGNDDLGTPPSCTGGNQNARISINVSKGSDHILTTYSSGDGIVNDHDACPNRSEDINVVVFEPGAPTSGVTEGMVDPVSENIQGTTVTGSARLACDSPPCANVRGRSLDHRPLWSYLDGACSGVSAQDSMASCLSDWNAGTISGVIFDADIAQNGRFAAVPILSPAPSGPNDNYILEFIPVWIESAYFDCNVGECDTVHSPGGTSAGACPAPLTTNDTNCGWDDTSGPDGVEQVTAFRLHLDMLPSSISDFFPGVGKRRTTALTR